MEQVVDAKLRFKTYADKNGFKIVETYLGNSKSPYTGILTKKVVGTNFKGKEYNPKFNQKEIHTTSSVIQESVDYNSPSLAKRMGGNKFKEEYLPEKYFDTTDKDVLKEASKMMWKFQPFYNLGKIPKEGGPKTTAEIFDKIIEANDFISDIQKNGGKLGPIQGIAQGAKDFTPFMKEKADSRTVLMSDLKAVEALRAKYADRFRITKIDPDNPASVFPIKKGVNGKPMYDMKGEPIYDLYSPRITMRILSHKENKNIKSSKVKEVIDEIKKTNQEYNSILDRTDKGWELKKDVRNKFIKYWEEKEIYLNKGEKDAVGFYLLTSPLSNVAMGKNFIYHNYIKNKSGFVYRFNEIADEIVPEMARKYYLAREGYYSEKVSTLQKYLKGKNVKIEEKAAQKLVESPIKGKKWLVDILKKHKTKKSPVEKHKNIMPIFSKGKSPMTIPQTFIKSGAIKNNIEKKINFLEEQTSGYRNRTIKNASADATIALAMDFKVPGERLTKSSVLNQNKKYIPIDANSLKITKKRIDKIVNSLNSVNAKTLNIAGNGIYDMKSKYTQKQIDDFTYNLLKNVLNSPNLRTKIESIRSGGQTGFDEAGIKAAQKLGIPATVLAPKGWIFRNINSQDIYNKEQFKDRFNIKNIQPGSKPRI